MSAKSLLLIRRTARRYGIRWLCARLSGPVAASVAIGLLLSLASVSRSVAAGQPLVSPAAAYTSGACSSFVTQRTFIVPADGVMFIRVDGPGADATLNPLSGSVGVSAARVYPPVPVGGLYDGTYLSGLTSPGATYVHGWVPVGGGHPAVVASGDVAYVTCQMAAVGVTFSIGYQAQPVQTLYAYVGTFPAGGQGNGAPACTQGPGTTDSAGSAVPSVPSCADVVVVAADETGGLAGIQQAVLLGFGLLVCLFAAVLIVSVARVAR